MTRRLLCKLADVKRDGSKEVTLDDETKICVINAGGEFFACQATCPHQGTPLCDGVVEGSRLTCLKHLWQWDLRTGEPVGLAEEPLPIFAVEVEGESLFLKS